MGITPFSTVDQNVSYRAYPYQVTISGGTAAVTTQLNHGLADGPLDVVLMHRLDQVADTTIPVPTANATAACVVGNDVFIGTNQFDGIILKYSLGNPLTYVSACDIFIQCGTDSGGITSMCSDGTYLYCAGNSGAGVFVITLADFDSGATVVFYEDSLQMPFTSFAMGIHGGLVYVANAATNTIDIFDNSVPGWVASIPLPQEPLGMHVAPDAIWVNGNNSFVIRVDYGAYATTVYGLFYAALNQQNIQGSVLSIGGYCYFCNSNQNGCVGRINKTTGTYQWLQKPMSNNSFGTINTLALGSDGLIYCSFSSNNYAMATIDPVSFDFVDNILTNSSISTIFVVQAGTGILYAENNNPNRVMLISGYSDLNGTQTITVSGSNTFTFPSAASSVSSLFVGGSNLGASVPELSGQFKINGNTGQSNVENIQINIPWTNPHGISDFEGTITVVRRPLFFRSGSAMPQVIHAPENAIGFVISNPNGAPVYIRPDDFVDTNNNDPENRTGLAVQFNGPILSCRPGDEIEIGNPNNVDGYSAAFIVTI